MKSPFNGTMKWKDSQTEGKWLENGVPAQHPPTQRLLGDCGLSNKPREERRLSGSKTGWHSLQPRQCMRLPCGLAPSSEPFAALDGLWALPAMLHTEPLASQNHSGPRCCPHLATGPQMEGKAASYRLDWTLRGNVAFHRSSPDLSLPPG